MRVIFRGFITITVAICLILALSAVGQCAIVRVSTAGEDSPAHDGSTWALAKRTVQAGINAAASGDEVWVAAGTYVQCITLGAGVGLYGGFAGTETERPQRNGTTNATILDGNKAGSVVTCPSGAASTTVIDGFTIRNGQGNGEYGGSGGGIYCSNGSPTISNNTISGNKARGLNYAYGGGIYCGAGSPTISNNTISGNTASLSYGYGGGIYCGAGSPIISNNTISGNTASGSYGYGGGIYCDGGTPTISNNTISGNTTSGGYGGGIYCGAGSPTISNNTISGNTASSSHGYGGDGGGIYCDGGTPTISNNTISDNTASASNYGGGGGIYCNGGTSTISNNTISGNTASGYDGGGGGIYCNGSPTISNNTISDNTASTSNYGGEGGGIYCNGSAAISNNTISDNTASTSNYGGEGGGIYCNGSAAISNNTISGNTASCDGSDGGDGGGIYCNGSPTISNNTISGNTASSCDSSGGGCGYGGEGGGIYYSGAGSPAISNNTISGNTASGKYSGGGGIAGGSGGSWVNNIVAFNSSGIYTWSGLIEHNNCVYNPAGINYHGISAGTGDISADPLFVAASSGDYHLSIGSPCIDAGDNAVVQQGWTDRDGNPRIFPTGGVVDMGCYESALFGITISSPTTSYVYSASVSPLAISGTTTDNIGNVTGLTWSNDRGGSGACIGTAAWSADGIVLQPGQNIIKVTASDDMGNSTSVVLTVYYYSVPSTVTITNPTSEPAYTTTDTAINLSGTATGYFGIVSVRWSNSRGGSGTCAGTTSWSVSGIILQPGGNVITITSTDPLGNTASTSITVTRTPISVGAARQLPAGRPAFVADAVVTATNVGAGSVFVESSDRSSGIKLVTSQSLSVGQPVQFTGTTGRVNGEYQISNVTFLDIVPAPPLTPLPPLGMTSRSIGNDTTEQLNYVGLNTTGLLIRYAGKVVIKSTTERFVYVDDGGSFEDGLSAYFRGIRVYIPTGVTIPNKNTMVVITGILRPEKHILPAGGGEVNGDWYPEGTTVYIPSIWMRDSSDIFIK